MSKWVEIDTAKSCQVMPLTCWQEGKDSGPVCANLYFRDGPPCFIFGRLLCAVCNSQCLLALARGHRAHS